MFTKILSIIIGVIVTLLIPFSCFAESISNINRINYAKISNELLNNISKSSNELLPVCIWFSDISMDSVKAEAEKTVGYSYDDIQQMQNNIPKINPSVFELKENDFELALCEYVNNTKEERKILSQKHNLLNELKTKLTIDAYEKYNSEISKAINLYDYEIAYISKFSPVIFLHPISKNRLLDLIKCDEVIQVNYYEKGELSPEFSTALPAVEADYTKNTLGFDGYGVNVGILDVALISSHPELTNSNITKLNIGYGRTDTDHSTCVARIIVGENGIAPNAHVYSDSPQNNLDASFYICFENLLSRNVKVINMSCLMNESPRVSNNYYSDVEKWVDHIANNHSVTVVKSAGNNGVLSTVTKPGLAYNVITVGGTDTINTVLRSDDVLYDIDNDNGGSAANGGASGCSKPDVVAPVRYYQMSNGFGTSFSAPTVTGIIAQMMEYDTTLKDKPAAVKAIITSSTDKKVTPGACGSTEAWAGPLTAQQGAGQINARRCMSIIGKGHYITGNIQSGTISKTFSVTSSDAWIRYNVSWLNNSTVSGNHYSNPGTITLPNIKLQIYNPNNVSVGMSNITNSSVELVHFTVGTTGTYTAKITRMDSHSNSVPYAVAWY